MATNEVKPKASKETTKQAPKLRSLRGSFAKFEEAGDHAQGEYIGFTFINMKNGTDIVAVPKYTLINETGDPVSFLGSTQIVEAFQRIPIGTFCRVEYTGEKTKTSNGFNVKEMDVQVDEAVMLLPPLDMAQMQSNAAQFALDSGKIIDGQGRTVDTNTGEIDDAGGEALAKEMGG